MAGADRVVLSGFGANGVAAALATQVVSQGSTNLTLGDGSVLHLLGVTKVDASLFG